MNVKLLEYYERQKSQVNTKLILIRSIWEVLHWCSVFIPPSRYIVINVVKPISDNLYFIIFYK